MLPKTTIHINPKFRKVHINPSFLGKSISEKAAVAPSPSQIYINPRFLQHLDPNEEKATQILTSALSASNDLANNESTFLLQSNDECTRRLQEPLADTSTPTRKKICVPNGSKLPPSPLLPSMNRLTTSAKPLIKIGMRKLIRVGSQTAKPTASVVKRKIRKPILTKYKIVKEQTAYKIDRRSVKCKRSVDLASNAVVKVAARKLSLSSIRRTWISESLAATKVIRT